MSDVQPGIFEGRGSFCKLGYIFWQSWKSKLNVTIKVRFFQLQFHDKKNPQ